MSNSRSDRSNCEEYEIVDTSQESGVKNVPSNYFKTDVLITSKKRPVSVNVTSNNSNKSGPGLLDKQDNPSSSGSRKLVVSVNTKGPVHQKEISVTSSFSSSKKVVDSSTQFDRKLIGQEQCLIKETKKLVRPPLVGQAAGSQELPCQTLDRSQSSSDSEVEKSGLSSQSRHEYSQPSSSYFSHIEPAKTENKSEKGSKNSDKYDSVPQEDSQRGPSPGSASSLTSRPLEWDSGADVGYDNAFMPADLRLSTLEKIALIKGSASIFTRSDPEGTTEQSLKGIPQKNTRIGFPTAESTPIGAPVRGVEKPSDKNKLHLFPEVIIKKMCSDSNPSSPDFTKEKLEGADDREGVSKKLSSSLENVAHCSQDKVMPSTFPRSHSQANVNVESNIINANQRTVEGLKSHSSSSVSTVVNKNNLPKKSSVCVQTRSRSSANSDGDLSVKSVDEDVNGASRKQSPEGTGGECNTLESGPLTGEARVNSFEYLPGHVYENAVANGNQPESLMSNDEGAWPGSDHQSLKEDVDRGVNLLAEFFRTSKAQDPALKRQLVQRVVNEIINASYSDDEKIIPHIKSSSYFHQNRMFEVRGQISGESSMEKSQNSDASKSKANKCVGTGVSTTLSGCSESSEWNSFTGSQKGVKGRRNSERKGSTNENSDYPKTSDDSSRGAGDNFKNVEEKPVIDEEKMIAYLNKERKSQLYWIKSEISHLSNLKMLLEKHEVLKKNLASLKKGRMKLEQPLKTYSEKLGSKKLHRPKDGLLKAQSAPNQGKTKSSPQLFSTTSSTTVSSFNEKDNGWTSHHYDTEYEEAKGTENIENVEPQIKKHPKAVKARSEMKPTRSTAYALNFSGKSAPQLREVPGSKNEDDILLSVGELKTAIDKIVEKHRKPSPQLLLPQPSLKDYLESARPDYIARAESRRQILSELVELRQARQASKTRIIAGGSEVPPPPLASKRVFSQKSLRKQTETKYRQLSEVKNKKAELKRKEEYRTNRLMAEIFTRKLQKKTLKGQVNLSNSVCVISPP